MIDINEITDTAINVHHKGEDITICKKGFHQWVDYNDKREWLSDWSDDAGGHRQDSGLMSWEEYYRSIYFNNDLEDYIKVRDAKTGKLRDLPDMAQSLNKLLTKIKTA